MCEYSPKCNVQSMIEPYLLPISNSECRHKLDIIENLFPVHESVSNLEIGDINIYPRAARYEELKQAIAHYVGVANNNIIITAGSDNGLKLIFDTFCAPDIKVLLPLPTYPHAQHFIKLSGAEITEHSDFDLAYIVSPNIVYGGITPLRTIKKLCKRDRVIIVDEAYIEFSDAESAAKLVSDCPNLIVVRTFSKAFAIAGLRLGYLITSDVNATLLSKSHNPKTVTDLAMRAGIQSLAHVGYYRGIWSQFEDEKCYLREELTKIISEDAPITGYNISHGNFYLLRCSDTKEVDRGVFTLRDRCA